MQEQTQQPTLPQSIRVMERKGGRKGGRTGGRERDRERGGRGRSEEYRKPICLVGHRKGRLRDNAEMTRHRGKRVSPQEEGFHVT